MVILGSILSAKKTGFSKGRRLSLLLGKKLIFFFEEISLKKMTTSIVFCGNYAIGLVKKNKLSLGQVTVREIVTDQELTPMESSDLRGPDTNGKDLIIEVVTFDWYEAFGPRVGPLTIGAVLKNGDVLVYPVRVEKQISNKQLEYSEDIVAQVSCVRVKDKHDCFVNGIIFDFPETHDLLPGLFDMQLFASNLIASEIPGLPLPFPDRDEKKQEVLTLRSDGRLIGFKSDGIYVSSRLGLYSPNYVDEDVAISTLPPIGITLGRTFSIEEVPTWTNTENLLISVRNELRAAPFAFVNSVEKKITFSKIQAQLEPVFPIFRVGGDRAFSVDHEVITEVKFYKGANFDLFLKLAEDFIETGEFREEETIYDTRRLKFSGVEEFVVRKNFMILRDFTQSRLGWFLDWEFFYLNAETPPEVERGNICHACLFEKVAFFDCFEEMDIPMDLVNLLAQFTYDCFRDTLADFLAAKDKCTHRLGSYFGTFGSVGRLHALLLAQDA
jgi:hypothetical protein